MTHWSKNQFVFVSWSPFHFFTNCPQLWKTVLLFWKRDGDERSKQNLAILRQRWLLFGDFWDEYATTASLHPKWNMCTDQNEKLFSGSPSKNKNDKKLFFRSDLKGKNMVRIKCFLKDFVLSVPLSVYCFFFIQYKCFDKN